jgi:DNA-binding CsgD family transcriptional regulator
LYVGAFDVAQCADEAGRLSEETGQPRWAAIARVGEAAVSGLRTGEMATDVLVAAENLALEGAVSMRSLLAGIQFARGVTFLSAGDFSAAYSALHRLMDREDPSYHRVLSLWGVGYFAEAAALSGHHAECRALLDRLEPVYEQAPSIGIRVAMDYARAMVDDATTLDVFTQALAQTTTLPWHRARLQLALGSWLRRNRRPVDARDSLRSARDTFEALAMSAWSSRADRELLATGERQQRTASPDWTSLSAQEGQIVELAAQGKTNREIGQELYISHRTVSAHLYHIFPKLGINSRSQLGALLAARADRTAARAQP